MVANYFGTRFIDDNHQTDCKELQDVVAVAAVVVVAVAVDTVADIVLHIEAVVAKHTLVD